MPKFSKQKSRQAAAIPQYGGSGSGWSRAEKPVQSIIRDDLAYQRESTDSDAKSHQGSNEIH